MKHQMAVWLRAVRAPFFTASIVPVALGGAVAWAQTGQVPVGLWALCFAGVVLAHAGSNMINDFFDHLSGNDVINQYRSPFNGGSGSIQSGALTARQMRDGAIVCYFAGFLIALYLVLLRGALLVPLVIAGAVSGFLYTAHFAPLAHHGLGELAVGLCFGPLPVMGTYYVLTGSFSFGALTASVPVAFLICAVLFINQFPDYEADRAVGKANWVVRLGTRRAAIAYALILACAYGSIIAGVATGTMALWSLLGLLTLPAGVVAAAVARRWHSSPRQLLPASALTVAAHLMTGLLVSFGYYLNRVHR